MSHRATIQLDPAADGGLTITADVYDDANALAETIDCPETGANTARYSGTSAAALADGVYDVVFLDAAGSLRGTGNLFMSGGAEVSPSVNVVETNGDPLVPDPGGGGTGSGDTSINHDGATGVTVAGLASATDCMRAVDELGAPLDDAEITAYLKADYDAGRKGPSFRQAFVRTGSDGRWVDSMHLDAGAYTFEAAHDNLGVVTFDVVVP